MRMRPIPFDEFRRDLLAMYEPPLRAIATKREITHILNLVAELGVKTTADLTTGLIARVCESVPPGQSARTLQKHLRYLRVVANFAVCNGWLKVSPVTRRPLRQWVPRVGPPAPKKWFPAPDVRRVLDLLQEDCQTTAGWARWKSYRLWAVTSVVALAGLRATEALTLEVADADLDRRIIDITARRRLKTN
jgi:integrase